MRWPRVRFTIARLMVLIALVGLTAWGIRLVQNRRVPSIAEIQAQASYQQAKLVREVAEYALKEYQDGIYAQDLATARGQIATAKSDQERAIDRLRWSTEMKTKGYVSPATHIADQLAKQQADFDLEQAKMQFEVLEKYTKEKQLKSFRSDIEKAQADEKLRFEAWQAERTRRLWWGTTN